MNALRMNDDGGDITRAAASVMDVPLDRAAIKSLINVNKRVKMSPYPISDLEATYNVEIGEIVFATGTRRAASTGSGKTALNGESSEAARLYANAPPNVTEAAVYAHTLANTRYLGVADTAVQFSDGIEDVAATLLTGVVNLHKGHMATREIKKGDRIYALAPPPSRALPPNVAGAYREGVPTNKIKMVPVPLDPQQPPALLLAHARLVAYDPAKYADLMKGVPGERVLDAAVANLFAFVKLVSVLTIRRALADGVVELPAGGGAFAAAVAAGSSEAAAFAGGTPSEKADAAAAVMSELTGAVGTRTFAAPTATRSAFQLLASNLIDDVLYDGRDVRSEFGFVPASRTTDQIERYRARYTNRNVINSGDAYGATATLQINGALRALAGLQAFSNELEKNYMGKAMSATVKDGKQAFDCMLGAR